MRRLLSVSALIGWVLSAAFPVAAQVRDTKPILAVMELEDSGKLFKPSDLSAAEDTLRAYLGLSQRFTIVDKGSQSQEKKRVVQDLGRESQDVCVDERCRVELGKKVAADEMLYCKLSKLGSVCLMNCEQVRLDQEATSKGAVAELPCNADGLLVAVKSVVYQLTGYQVLGTSPTTPSDHSVPTGPAVVPPGGYVPQDSDALVRFETDPEGARVRLDGTELCDKTPCSKLVALGRHRVLFSHVKGYDVTVDVNVNGEQTVSKVLSMKEGGVKVVAVDQDGNVLKGTASVHEESGASKELGTVPGTFKLVVGDWLVTVTTELGVWSGPVRIEERKTTRLTPEFKKEVAGMERKGMMFVPAASYWMGCNSAVDSECGEDESPSHQVSVGAFWMDKLEVTVADYGACVKAGACSRDGVSMPYWSDAEQPGWSWSCNWGMGREQHPMNCLTWTQAKTYCEWRGKRLPTEAEWELAARGTDGRKYAWGNDAYGTRGPVANITDASALRAHSDWTWAVSGYDDGYEATAPVGSFPNGASPYGILDLIGNVWEWCSDWYDEGYYPNSPSQNPLGPDSGQTHTVRGGSWGYQPSDCRSSNRSWGTMFDRSPTMGLRCVVAPENFR